LALVLVLCLPVLADEDAEGCKDSKLMPRFRGCWISECKANEFDSGQMLVGLNADGGESMKTVEGAMEEISYMCPEGISPLQIARNVEGAMRQSGFTMVFNAKDAWDNPAVTGRKRAQWIFVRQAPSDHSYMMTAVLEQKVVQEMTVNADALAAEIESSGRVAVYGINFDTGKATLKPDSEAVLAEIHKLLGAHPDWKIRVEGHTDNTGAKATNQALSAQRAGSVAAWLAAKGVDKNRMTTQGFGDSKPVADNSTEDGRAKNRRVELVKM